MRWKRPRSGWVKVNCDGALSALENDKIGVVAGITVVIRDEEGKVIAEVAKKENVNSSIEIEAVALKEGSCLAESQKLDKIILETILNFCIKK